MKATAIISGDITWVGNTKYPIRISCCCSWGFKKGRYMTRQSLKRGLRHDDDAVSSIYLDDGYLFFSINPVELRIDNDSIDLEMRIREGDQATINRVI
jgi:outer membrane protein insertion porin family